MDNIQNILEHLFRQAALVDRTIRIMEICGTHTVAIQRAGIRSLLPKNIKLISGPGCPVCVTPAGYIDALIELAGRKDVVIATYGDMVRVTGSKSSLAAQRAEGRNVQVVVSASDGLAFAMENPGKQVVFAGVGFETTTPPTADVILRADQKTIRNFSALTAHKLVIPAIEALLVSPTCAIDGFLCPGHVSVLIGADAYKPIAEKFLRPCVVAGFDALQIIAAIDRIVSQVVEKQSLVENIYSAVVKPEPLLSAKKLVDEVFATVDTEWRALGIIPESGLAIKSRYGEFDSQKKFHISIPVVADPPGCRCAEVIQGLIDPVDCPLFGRRCTPIDPVGPCMVSSEGACQAWYKYS
ncbi:MAG: hydrogenase formation protein HypD [Phycisphaerae bacterium]